MSKRSEQSKLRRGLQKSHMIEMLSAAYHKATNKDPTQTMLVTQEVRNASERVIGINYWFDLNTNQDVVAFMSNVTAGLYKAVKDDNVQALNAGLKLIEEFYDRHDDKPSKHLAVDVPESAS